MGTTTQRTEIKHDLDIVSAILSDVEWEDGEWGEIELVSFSYEWADMSGRVKDLRKAFQSNKLPPTERQAYEALQARFLAADSKIKALDFTNPFEE